MNRIEKRMEELQNKNEKAFVTYMTAGLPDMEGTKALIKAQAEPNFWQKQELILSS